MGEAKPVGVEVVADVAGAGGAVGAGAATNGVEGITEEGVACGGEMDADLVGSACGDGDF